MPMRKINFVENEYYHIFNRGNSKQTVFKDQKDYTYFIELLYILNTNTRVNLFDLKRKNSLDIFAIDRTNPLVAIGTYCLMPNHFHILLTPLTENGVSKFMQKISTGYSMYFNRKYKRVGSLFEGKFKSEHASEDRYLKYLFSYIHLNPIKLIQKDWKEVGLKNKSKALTFLDTYDYSSYLDYLYDKRKEQNILNKKVFPSYFSNQRDFSKEIWSWITLR
jgi:putative transposase